MVIVFHDSMNLVRVRVKRVTRVDYLVITFSNCVQSASHSCKQIGKIKSCLKTAPNFWSYYEGQIEVVKSCIFLVRGEKNTTV